MLKEREKKEANQTKKLKSWLVNEQPLAFDKEIEIMFNIFNVPVTCAVSV